MEDLVVDVNTTPPLPVVQQGILRFWGWGGGVNLGYFQVWMIGWVIREGIRHDLTITGNILVCTHHLESEFRNG